MNLSSESDSCRNHFVSKATFYWFYNLLLIKTGLPQKLAHRHLDFWSDEADFNLIQIEWDFFPPGFKV